MTFAALEARLKRPSGLFVMTLVAMASVGIVRALMYWHGLPGWDDAAHVYKVFLLREGQGVFWDNFWYGGSYGAITYGFVYYWLAQYVPGPVLVALASGPAAALLLPLPARAPGGSTTCGRPGSSSPCCACTRRNGQDPFVVALCLSMAGLALLGRGRVPSRGAPRRRRRLRQPAGAVRRRRLPAGRLRRPSGAAPAVPRVRRVADAVRGGAGRRRASPSPSRTSYVNEFNQIVLFLSFALAGLALAGLNAVAPPASVRPAVRHLRRDLRRVVSDAPAARWATTSAASSWSSAPALLLLLRNDRLRRLFGVVPLTVIPIVLFALLQLSSAYSHYTNHSDLRATEAVLLRARAGGGRDALRPGLSRPRRRAAPALGGAVLPRGGLPDHARLVPAGGRHPQQPVLRGVRRGRVPRVAAAHGRRLRLPARRAARPVEPARARHPHATPALLEAGRAPRRLAGVPRARTRSRCSWRSTAALAHVEEFDHLAVRFVVERPGRFLLKVTYTPYWRLDGGERARGRRPLHRGRRRRPPASTSCASRSPRAWCSTSSACRRVLGGTRPGRRRGSGEQD